MTAVNQRRRRPSRWWIACLVPAIAAMLIASGYRVNELWFDNGPHLRAESAEAGQWVDAALPYTDAFGDTTRTFSVRFTGWGPESDTTSEFLGRPEVVLPAGLVTRSVDLEFRAAPDQALRSCVVALVDSDGREYRTGFNSPLGSVDPCVPAQTPGPSVSVTRDQPRGMLRASEPPRPQRWSVRPTIVTPMNAHFVELRIWYTTPRYVSLVLPS